MDPSTLAVVGTNSMLEPIRRAIGKQNLREMLGMCLMYFFSITDSALPTQPGEHILDENGQTHQDVEKVLNASDIGKFAKPYPTDVSLENPLLGLSPQEYLAFK